MKIIKYVVQIPYEVMIDWTESRTNYTEVICERKEEAIQIFRDIIANNLTYLEDDVQGNFYIVERVIDIEKFVVQNTELYYASIHNKKITGTGINGEKAYLSDTPSSYYKTEFYEYQEKIRQLLSSDLLIEEQEKIKKLYIFIDNMRDESSYYNDAKNQEEKYEKMKWWEN